MRHKLNIYRNLFIILIVTLLAGCAKNRVEALNKRLDSYWNSMRWQAVGSVSNMIDAEQRQDLVNKLAAELAKTRVVDYNVVHVDLDADQQTARTTVAYSYYYLESNELKQAQTIQHWRYDHKQGWMLTTKPKP